MRAGEARLGEPGQPRPAVDEIPPELMSLADRYLAVSIPDWAERVRAKDDLALQMGSYIITHRTPRDLLAEQEQEGVLVGLASAINAVPEWGDAQRLIKASAKLTRFACQISLHDGVHKPDPEASPDALRARCRPAGARFLHGRCGPVPPDTHRGNSINCAVLRSRGLTRHHSPVVPSMAWRRRSAWPLWRVYSRRT
jgi:hypothetical protein